MALDISHLNTSQQEAVTHKSGPLLILAGAGTGKTTVIAHRVAWLIEQGLAKPDEILCLTFTDKAAGEMEGRIDSLLPYGYVDLWVMTFHAFGERLLRAHGVDIGIPSDFTLLDDTAQWMLLHDHLEEFKLDYYRPLGNPTKFITPMLSHFSKAKDESILPHQYIDHVENIRLDSGGAVEFVQFQKKKKKKVSEEEQKELWTQEIAKMHELAHAYHVYQQLLHKAHVLDFGDLILFTKKLLEDRPHILESYRKKFKYILVDEFQDTNWAQYDLVKLLAAPGNNITVVGDDDQSIYKFRGASLSNILGYTTDFPNAKQVVLTDNYRSGQSILDLSYEFIQHNNPNRLEVALNQDSGIAPISKKLQSHSEFAGSIGHLHYSNLEEESIAVINKIVELKESQGYNWSDFSILVRANSAANPFIQQLTVAQIPYQFMASQGLFSKPVVMNVINYLKLIDAYHESTAMYQLLILPTVNLQNDDLMALLYEAKKHGHSLHYVLKIAATLDISDESKNKIEEVLNKMTKHSVMAREKRISEVAMAFMDDYGLKTFFETFDPLEQRATYDYLNQFWKFMRQFETKSDQKDVKTFLRYLELAQQAGDSGKIIQQWEEDDDSVKVMTIHGSKGLEFPVVFVTGMVDRRFPTTHKAESLPLPQALIKDQVDAKDHHLEEERRLCYVAMTRAKHFLFFTSADDYGGARKKKLSRFIYELGLPEPSTQTINIQWGESGVTPVVIDQKVVDYTKYLPRQFSYTQYTAFKTCPRQYWYAFLLKIPVLGSHSASFGKTMHNTLQIFFDRSVMNQDQGNLFSQTVAEPEFPGLQELLDIYEEQWIDDWYRDLAQKEEFRAKGRKMLREFYAVHEGKWPKMVSTERPFTLKIGKYTLKGAIDRIDEQDGKWELVDYKTGSVPATLKKDQLLIYQIACEEVFEKPVGQLHYYYLQENQAKSFLGTEKELSKIKEKLIQTFDELTTSDFSATPSPQNCKNCDFKSICSYRMI